MGERFKAEELDARPADTAKELLARAQNFVDRKYVAHSDERQFAMGLGYVTAERQDLAEEMATFAADTLRLSARQQASVEEVRQWLNEQPYKSSTLAERLLAEYDIFEKVEG